MSNRSLRLIPQTPLQRFETRAVIVCMLLILVLPLIVHQAYWRNIFVVCLYYAIIASSWNLLAGYTGQFSLAPAAFSSIGAYTVGVLNYLYGVPVLVGIPIAVIVSAAIGALLGVTVLRMRGPYLALTTFAFLEVVNLLISNSYNVTRGDLGLSIPGLPGVGALAYHYIFSAALFVVVLSVWLITRTRSGLFIRAIRNDEFASQAAGVNVVLWKTLVFIFNSAACGLAGALYVVYLNLASPELGNILESGIIIAMAVVGGMGSILGPLIGAFGVEISTEFLRGLNIQYMLVLSFLMILVIRYARRGIWGVVGKIHFKMHR